MAEYPPFRASGSFNTQLSPLQEMLFRDWVQKNGVPFDVDASGPSDYDMRGYYQGLQNGNPMAWSKVNPNDKQLHYTDYYKTPLHQTFSKDSQWAGPSAPHWINGSQLASSGGRILYDEAAEADMSPLARLLAVAR